MWNTNKQQGTKHTADCKRVFNHYDLTCPRCKELADGAAARKGWGDDKRQMEVQRSAAIKAHNFINCPRCKVICTCFEW